MSTQHSSVSVSDPDITEDLTEAQLAEAAFTEEIVVMWGDPRQWGVIVGYEPDVGMGRFRVDIVTRDDRGWHETGEVRHMLRDRFTVFGPANRDPGDRPGATGITTGPEDRTGVGFDVQAAVQEVLINVGSHGAMAPFLAAMVALLSVRTDNDVPAFRVRLDADATAGGWGESRRSHSYRILVRPVTQPMLHDELKKCLEVARDYALDCSLSNAGVEIHRPEDA